MTRHCDARSLALDALQALRRRDAYADAALDGLFGRHPELDARERALVTQLVYGVMRWRDRLDAHLAGVCSRPLQKLHPRLHDILRLGAFQILFLDRIPPRAAVSESVGLARSAGLSHAGGFVNAALRKLAAGGRDLPLPEDPAGRLSLQWSCPRWLVEAWIAEHGVEGAERLARGAAQVPTLTLRVDAGRLPRDEAVASLSERGLQAGPCRWAPEGVWVEGAGDPRGLTALREGLAVVQDQASQLVTHLVSPQPGWRVLDACAAPGLKATHLAQRMGGRGEVLALDIHAHRVRQIEALAARLGLDCVRALVQDGREFRCDDTFDAVLVDAPCSGLGVLARTPEAKWRRRPEDPAALSVLQLELLGNLADAVRPGGLLVYSTCTTLRTENEAVVQTFLAGHPDFRMEPPPEGVAWEGLLTADGALRTFPTWVGEPGAEALDGFFGARLVRGRP